MQFGGATFVLTLGWVPSSTLAGECTPQMIVQRTFFGDLDETDRKLPNTLCSLSPSPNAALKMPSEENKVSSSTSVSARRNTNVDTRVPCTQERIIRVVEFGRVRLRVHPHEPHAYCTKPIGRAPLRVDPIYHLCRIYEKQPPTLTYKVSKPPGSRYSLR